MVEAMAIANCMKRKTHTQVNSIEDKRIDRDLVSENDRSIN